MAVMEKTKILVIGLDGATFDLIEPWMNEGKLPTFAKLARTGVSGILTSVFPPISTSAWASFQTGKNPGKHGVMSFVMRKEKSYDQVAITPAHIDGKTLWLILSESGEKVGVTYVPFARVEKVNGFLIPGVFSRVAPGTTYPVGLAKELRKQNINCEIGSELYEYWPGTEDEYLRKIMEATEKITEVTCHLMEKYPCDFFMTTFFYGDQIQHYFWKYMDSQHPAHDSKKAKKYGNAILEYYQRVDEALQRILEKVGTQTVVIIMSDHGAGPVYKNVYINHWLMKMDLLKLKEQSKRSLKRSLFVQLTRRETAEMFVNSNLFKIIFKTIPIKLLTDKYTNFFLRSRPSFSDVDWTRTKAYSYSLEPIGQIFINLMGREPAGIVKPGEEYKELRDFLVRKLLELKDPENDENIVDKIIHREEVCWGPHTNHAADLFFTMKDMTYYTHPPEFDPHLNSLTGPPVKMASATHRMNGILMVAGSCIKKGVKIKGARIIDVAPTILHIMNVAIPSDMDGRVLKEAFEPGSDLAVREVSYVKPSEKRLARKRLSKEEEKQMMERLKALGYLS